MARSTPTRVVEGLAPFVERALDDRDAREALGPAGVPGCEPRVSGQGSGWRAAEHAGERVSVQRATSED